MLRTCLALTILALSASTAQAKLELSNIQCAYGPLLPERKALEFYPEDLIFFRYLVTGVKVDAAGRVDAEAVVKLIDGDGKEVAKNTVPFKARLSLGGDAFAGVAYLTLNEKQVNGLYTLSVTVSDLLGSEKASFQRDVQIRPAEFAIIRPRFSYDAEGRALAPVGGLVSQSLFFRIEAYGYDRSQDRVHLVSSVQVLDAAGKELLPEPLETVLKSEDAKLVQASPVATFNGSLGLHRPGDFTLRITVNDKIGGKTAKLELPLRVALP
jgi:hypothetical protein